MPQRTVEHLVSLRRIGVAGLVFAVLAGVLGLMVWDAVKEATGPAGTKAGRSSRSPLESRSWLPGPLKSAEPQPGLPLSASSRSSQVQSGFGAPWCSSSGSWPEIKAQSTKARVSMRKIFVVTPRQSTFPSPLLSR